jgi:hypothetical protein
MQHDKVPPHTTREVTALLNEHFADRWLGIWTCAMAPRSPDLSPLDFFVWGCMKSRVYLNEKPDTRQQLMQRINEAVLCIRNELVIKQWMKSLKVHVLAYVQA